MGGSGNKCGILQHKEWKKHLVWDISKNSKSLPYSVQSLLNLRIELKFNRHAVLLSFVKVLWLNKFLIFMQLFIELHFNDKNFNNICHYLLWIYVNIKPLSQRSVSTLNTLFTYWIIKLRDMKRELIFYPIWNNCTIITW